MACTSDFAVNVFPLWGSQDGSHWVSLGSIFPRGHLPSWALPTGKANGRYWAPDLEFIDGHWVVYFAAVINPARAHLGVTIPARTMVIGVATTTNLRGGRWHSRILHYSGEFNRAKGKASQQERRGGVIDPNEFQDPSTGQRYLVYAKQANQIWLGTLSGDGLHLNSDVREIEGPSEPWECATPKGKCTLEGPIGYFYQGVAYVMDSVASTWKGTYAVGVAASSDPMHQAFVKDPLPILTSSHHLLGPGGASEPVQALDGGSVIYFHSLLGKPDLAHVSGDRYLTVGRFHYSSTSSTQPADNRTLTGDSTAWPQISNGQPKLFTTLLAR